jgi:uncharacterized protein YjiS (DUF1127 family)
MTTAALLFRAHRTTKVIGLAILVVGAVKHRLLGWLARRILARAIDELRAMDDRMLADIGLKRSEIEAACRFGRRWVQRSIIPRREGARPG